MLKPGDNRPRILIVEDDPINAEILVDALGDPYQITQCPDGGLASKTARTQAPDLILLDLMLPTKNGFEVCKELKADPATAGIPVIFVTATTSEINEAVGLGLGAVDYIYKPFNPVVVRARVALHVRLKLQSDFISRLVDQRTRDLKTAREEALELLRLG